MKTKERIKVRLEQSRIGRSAEDIWFYSDISQGSQLSGNQRKFARTDRQSTIQDIDDNNSFDKSSKLGSKKEDSFIVDWQMSDVL